MHGRYDVVIAARRPLSVYRCSRCDGAHKARARGRRGVHTAVRHDARDVAPDKWDSCRAIDCARRTDRLALMCFVVLSARDSSLAIGISLPTAPLGVYIHEILARRRGRDVAREIRPIEIPPRIP